MEMKCRQSLFPLENIESPSSLWNPCFWRLAVLDYYTIERVCILSESSRQSKVDPLLWHFSLSSIGSSQHSWRRLFGFQSISVRFLHSTHRVTPLLLRASSCQVTSFTTLVASTSASSSSTTFSSSFLFALPGKVTSLSTLE